MYLYVIDVLTSAVAVGFLRVCVRATFFVDVHTNMGVLHIKNILIAAVVGAAGNSVKTTLCVVSCCNVPLCDNIIIQGNHARL